MASSTSQTLHSEAEHNTTGQVEQGGIAHGAVFSDSGNVIKIPVNNSIRTIECFVTPRSQPQGVFMHLPGEEWVAISGELRGDLLGQLAQSTNLLILTVEYETVNDSRDVGFWLAQHAPAVLGAPLKFIGGDETGGHLAAFTTHHLRQNEPRFPLLGVIAGFGTYPLNRPILAADSYPANIAEDPPLPAERAVLAQMSLPPCLMITGPHQRAQDIDDLLSVWAVGAGQVIHDVFSATAHHLIMANRERAYTLEQSFEEWRDFILARLDDRQFAEHGVKTWT